MIKLVNLTKFYPSKIGRQYVFKDLNFEIPDGHNIAILGKNGAGKSTLFRILAGSEYPNTGQIRTKKKFSWPVALATGIHPKMTGRENTRFIGRVNGVFDLDDYEQKVFEFAGLKKKFDLPVKNYSSGMRSRLAFACCISIDFDIYLIDEATSVGDPSFKRKAKDALLSKSRSANVIMVSHELDDIRMFCDSAIVINDGELTFYNNLEQAIDIYQAI
ncbi:ABC transporter ATP-binding protein [Thalassotalea crassostreae]|uniref:ABC transporter ATP-binding protein n=1 Tax=Thalassotalea crassostreae TaxID=1763536 RepID=UPI000837D1F7|nr:ABC transporter ATP-binding protein [Thalassotalea crassostreae]